MAIEIIHQHSWNREIMHTQTRGKCHEKQAKRSVTFAVSFRYCILASEPSPLHLIDLKSKFIEQHTGCDHALLAMNHRIQCNNNNIFTFKQRVSVAQWIGVWCIDPRPCRTVEVIFAWLFVSWENHIDKFYFCHIEFMQKSIKTFSTF